MFENVYIMDIKRYQRWTAPIVHKAKGFWIWMSVLALGTVGTIYFYTHDVSMRWQGLGLMLMLIGVYRGLLFRKMLAGKQFKLMRAHSGMREWECKVVVGNTIRLFINNEPNNEVFFKQVEKFVEAKSYFDMKVENDFVRLDKACFTKGTADEFKAWMAAEHPEIPYEEEAPEFNR